MLSKFNKALGEVFLSLSDGSLKVGIQGMDSNRWRINEVLSVLELYNKFAVEVEKETGSHVAPVDVWGGGQVSQVPRFLGEDPYENLIKMKEVAPNLVLKCIYRGQQAFGFLPTSDEIQRLSIIEASASGMQIFRMFDPFQDANNLKAGVNAVNEYRENQIKNGVAENKLVSAEGLIFYIKPPIGIEAVWTAEENVKYAIKLAKMGFHEISLSDYAGQITEPEIAAKLIKDVRAGLDENCFKHIPVNFFGLGSTTEILQAALKAGAKEVDVAIGNLAGGPSNVDMLQMTKKLMTEKGFDIESEQYKNHPALKALKDVEILINKISEKYLPYRMPFDIVGHRSMASSRLAFNAVPALDSAIKKNWDKQIKPGLPTKYRALQSNEAIPTYLKEALNASYDLWVSSGQVHAVSPFGFFFSGRK